MTQEKLLHSAAIALMRLGVVQTGLALPLEKLESCAYSDAAGMITVTYKGRSPVEFEYADAADGSRVYTCIANKYAVRLSPCASIYLQS